MLTAGASAEIVAAWQPETDAWTARREQYLLYRERTGETESWESR